MSRRVNRERKTLIELLEDGITPKEYTLKRCKRMGYLYKQFGKAACLTFDQRLLDQQTLDDWLFSLNLKPTRIYQFNGTLYLGF